MNSRNKKLLLILVVLMLFVSIGKETYALFTSEVSSIVQNFGTGTLKLSYSNTTINLDNAYPMSDSDGMSITDTSITITNVGTLAYKFNVILEPSSSTLDSSLIKVSMDGENPAILSSDSNIIIRDVILNPGSSRTFTIKLWIPNTVSSSDILGKKFNANLTSSGIAVKDVEDSDGTVLIGGDLLYDYIKNNADTTTQIDFSKTSEASNTNGIYMTKDTDSGIPVYYYRGKVDNNVLFANFCWKIIRTTETGGVKLIYNGVPSDGQCNNTTSSATTIGASMFNSTYNDAKYVGYMYGDSIDDTANTNDSTIKAFIDTWYQNNMTSYTSQLEDTVFCNDRSYTGSGLDLYFGAYTRLITNKQPTLKCQNARDKFTVEASNGNGDLTYPVGLITADEIAYAGEVYGTNDSSYYLYNDYYYQWTFSPYYFVSSFARGAVGNLSSYSVGTYSRVRPVVSLKSGTEIESGDGTASSPFAIKPPQSLYDYIKKHADTTTQIDFSKTSEQSNTNGIYMTTDTEDNVPVYYYRGAVDNNVLFANFCWKIIRTTETGGVKLIYNGVPTNGECNNTKADSTIGSSEFNSGYDSPAYVGYMYNIVYTASSKDITTLSGSIVFGNDIDYDTSTKTYTLKDTYTLTDASNWSSEYTTIASKYHYTCLTSDNTCTSVYYVHYIYSSYINYFTLTNGKNHLDILEEMLNSDDINTKDSTIKTALDTWYKNNMTSHTSELEDTIFCNDRGYNDKLNTSGWNKDYKATSPLYFNSYSRLISYKPSLVCSRTIDKFTTNNSNGNGALTYPVGLITADEAAYAGGGGTSNSSYYLYNGAYQRTFSPFVFDDWLAYGFTLVSDGTLVNVNVVNPLGVSPVVSLKPGIAITGGSGTATDPFVVN